MALISVIVPVYAVEEYLPKCIDSILDQSYRDFELILVDDGSPDRCGEICDEYAGKDPRVKVIHKENGGVSAARNTGLDAATGEYIAFCDSDDYWHPDFLQRMLAEARRTEADLVACNYIYVDEQGEMLNELNLVPETVRVSDLEQRIDNLVRDIMSGQKSCAVWNRLFKARIIRENSIRFCTECENYAEDLGFITLFSCYAAVFTYISDKLYYYVNRCGSMMDRSIGMDLLRVICMLLVVGTHFYGHGGLVNGTLVAGEVNWVAGNVIYALTIVAVNCFVLLSGYFQCTSRFKLKRVLSVWVQVIFYSVALFIAAPVVCRLFGEEFNFSLKGMLNSVLVVTKSQYWFVTAYLLMYLVSPFLNCAIRAMDKRMHLMCCCVLLGIFSVAANLVYTSDFGNVNGGYSFLWFCILYIVAAYFRLYVPAERKHRKWGLLIYFCCAAGVALARFAAHYLFTWLLGYPKMTSLFYSYNSILVTSASVGLFAAMRTVKMSGVPEKIVRIIAPLAFGVYLIHDHNSVRPLLWGWLKPYAFADSAWMVPYSLACTLGIFLVCCGVEWVRKKLFRVAGIDKIINRIGESMQKWILGKFGMIREKV